MARTLTIIMTVVLIATTSAPSVLAHGTGDPYHSTVTRITPRTLPITATTSEQRYERLLVENKGTGRLIILDYQNEPYALVTPTAVFLNTRQGEPHPKWAIYEDEPAFAYHDHRAHWMAKNPPATIDPNNPRPQKIQHWRIPVTYNGTPGMIEGNVYYIKPTGAPDTSPRTSHPGLPLPAAGLAAGLLAAIGVLAASRTRRRWATRTNVEARHG